MNIGSYSFRQPLQPSRPSVRQPQFGMAVSQVTQDRVEPSYMTRYAEEAIVEHELFRLFSFPGELSTVTRDTELITYQPAKIVRNFIETWTKFSKATAPAIQEHPVIQKYLREGLDKLIEILKCQGGEEETQSILRALAKCVITSNPDFPDAFAQPLLEAAGLMEKTEARTYGALERKA